MKAFEFDRRIVESYASFSRSFSTIRAPDLYEAIARKYEEGHFWPDALLALNPHYEAGPTADDLVDSGDLCLETAQVFRFGSDPIEFHRHQGQAIAKASAGQSFVVTTGTGSGKSLCFFVPIVDTIIRARKTGDAPRTRAIVVYPMNALANSQIKGNRQVHRPVGIAGQPQAGRPALYRARRQG